MDLLSLTQFILLFAILLLIDYYYHHFTRVGRFADKIPGPRYLPIIGNVLNVNMPREQLWHFYRMNAKKFYPISKLWIFNQPIINVYHPDDVQILLTSHEKTTKGLIYEPLYPWLKNGLITSNGDYWHRHRKIITPAFHFDILSDFVDSFVEHADAFVHELRAETELEGVVKDILPLSLNLTLSMICETAMGTAIDVNNENHKNYINSIKEMLNIFCCKGFWPWLRNDWIFSLTEKGKAQTDCLEILHSFTTNIIKERKQYHDNTGRKYLNKFSTTVNETSDVEVETKGKRKRLALLDLLIAASYSDVGFTDHEIREEVDTFIFAGHDTTAISLVLTILLLAEHQDIQDKCRQEIREIMVNCDGKLTLNTVQQLNYLERCIKETLRMYPALPTLSRTITKDIQLKHCFLPRESLTLIQIADTHRDPNFWLRPNIFDPDRFLPEQAKNRHPFAYVPFSGGPRNCIGQKFAMLEMKTIMAKLLHNFYLQPMESAANVQLMSGAILRCRHPVYAKFVPICN